MANICEYHFIVKGPKNACYATYGSVPCLDDKYIDDESGTDDNYILKFSGDCKWNVDAYTSEDPAIKPVKLPKDPEEAFSLGEDYWGIPQHQKSVLFGVELQCNYADIEDYDPEWYDDCGGFYLHVDKNGNCIDDKCPEELYIKVEWPEDMASF